MASRISDCPKCGYQRLPAADEFSSAAECPRCGVIYSKVEKHETGAEQPAAAETEQPAAVKADSTMEKPGSPQFYPPEGPPRKNEYSWVAIVILLIGIIGGLRYWEAVTDRQKAELAASLQPAEQAPSADFLPQSPAAEHPAERPAMNDLPGLVEKIRPSVVSIAKYGKNRELLGSGSGFFINQLGHIITNFHVLEGASYVEIKTADNEVFPANMVVAENPERDLLQIATDSYISREPLELNVSLPKAGEEVVVIGSPMGLEQTVSNGIVSAIRRFKGAELIQITAPVSPGSSGSPVVNSRGEVIGVASATYGAVVGQNLNFAVPSINISVGMKNFSSGLSVADWAQRHKASGTATFFLDEKNINQAKPRPPPAPAEYSKYFTENGSNRAAFEKYVFEAIGGDPSLYNPQKMADNAFLAEEEKLFLYVFNKQKAWNRGRYSLTAEENKFWENTKKSYRTDLYRHHSEIKRQMTEQHRLSMERFDRVWQEYQAALKKHAAQYGN